MNPLWSPAVEARVRAEACSLDEQKVPAGVQQCTRCVVTNQRPRITFDAEGVCSACRYWEQKQRGIDWKGRGWQLVELLRKHRRESGYDLIVPSSGGKDSGFIAHWLKNEYGMSPLCVKFAPFMYTDIGWENFQSFVHSGFDVMTFFPNGIVHRKLARLAFEYLGDPFQPFVFGQLAYPMRIAAKFKIPLVFYGENAEAEYGGDMSASEKPSWDFADWERVYLKGAGVWRLVNIGVSLGVFNDAEVRDITEFYSLPDREMIGKAEFHWLGYYLPWHPMANFYYAVENTGFKPNHERSEGTYTKMSSLDDKLDGLHYYLSYVKFGIGRATSDAAQQIRAGDITKDEGVNLVRKYDGEFPAKHLDDCLEYLGMDREQLGRIIERFRAPHVRLEAA